MSPPDRIVRTTTCALCDRGRLTVPALVEVRPGRVVCSECTRLAVEALVTHYGDADVFMPAAPGPEAA